ncbi:MAG: hypothetical protein ACU833_01345 [Gammaproteobacteria bacterium]
MLKLIRLVFIGMLLLALASCGKKITPAELPPSIRLGGTYYTQFVIRHEKDTHLTTNYRRGASIPINTQVTLTEITGETIRVSLRVTGQELLIKNVEKYTRDDIVGTFNKLFGKEKVDLSRFTQLEKQQIKSGTVAKGMRKKAVLAAIGYPPRHATPSLDANEWTYWSSRFNRFIVYFENDKVSSILN